MLENIPVAIYVITGLFALTAIYGLIKGFIEVARGQRRFVGNGARGALNFIFSLFLMGGFAYCLYYIPKAFFDGVNWSYLLVSGPMSVIYGVLSFAVIIPLFYFYYMFTLFFVNKNDKGYVTILILSLVSGIANTLFIFIINVTLAQNGNRLFYSNFGIESDIYIYFILGILVFAISSWIVRRKLIVLTSNIIYEKRILIINKLLQTPFPKFEAIGNGKIYAVINNDTETISGFVNLLVSAFNALVIIAGCFVYLGSLSLVGLLVIILVILVASVFYYVAGRTAELAWEKNRDIQNAFFKHITDLIEGFKEVYINRKKRREFWADIEQSCEAYRRTRITGEFKFIGVTITGEILLNIVFGIAVFSLPLMVHTIRENILRSYILVLLYMAGAVYTVLNIIPSVIRVMISWRRMNAFIKELEVIDGEEFETVPLSPAPLPDTIAISLHNVRYQYKASNSEQFKVGPINYTFKTGEIIFITGGNGSGKSTLAKILTGLYRPDEGSITVNGKETDNVELGERFAAIFSDFHLFDKLYGVNYREKQDEIEKYLKLLRIQDKVQINDGVFSTLWLSTGQRKRLALLISYLEDRPFCLFDEWAADQDPVFRDFFYRVLLPELRAGRKGVIAITHDERYLDVADRVIKMELGQIVEDTQFAKSHPGAREALTS